jgi:hypothetical protein
MHISKVRLAAAGVLCTLACTGIGAGAAYAFQPHMTSAREYLQNADSQLRQAVPDKAGHRVNAINLVHQAITEVDLGIQAGAR